MKPSKNLVPPLQLEASFFQHITIDAKKRNAPDGANKSYRMGFSVNLLGNDRDALRYRINLGVNGQPEDGAWVPYLFQIDISGFFVLPKDRDDKDKLLLLTGTSMLYGAIREMLALITGRYPWGSFTLPTVAPEIFLRAAAQNKMLTIHGEETSDKT